MREKTANVIILAKMAIMVALICVCSWVTIPFGSIPFTLQTFGIAMALGTLGGKRGTAVIATYLLFGAVGLPVFSSFGSGIGVLLGPTGGYLIGFLIGGIVYLLIEHWMKGSRSSKYIGIAAFMLTYYVFGSIHFSIVGGIPFWSAVTAAVLPYIVPDVLKSALAITIGDRIARYI